MRPLLLALQWPLPWTRRPWTPPAGGLRAAGQLLLGAYDCEVEDGPWHGEPWVSWPPIQAGQPSSSPRR